MYLILAFSKIYMFLNSVLCRASLPVSVYLTALVHFHLQLELELFPFDTMSGVVGYAGGQTLGIQLFNFFGHQYEM